MEYLSLQDIPHSQYEPLHSRRMAHSVERQVGSMAAAVSHEPPTTLLHDAPRGSSHARDQPPLSCLHLPPPHKRPRPSPVLRPSHPISRNSRMGSYTWTSPEGDPREEDTYPNAIEEDLRRYSSGRPVNLTEEQSQFMRTSPPIQAGEKLPSFREVRFETCDWDARKTDSYKFVHRTRADTPPRTPSRRDDAEDDFPHGRPVFFEDVAWQDRKRRRDDRNDTLWDIHSQHGRPAYPTVPPPVDQKRISSAIDPALRYRHEHQGAPNAQGHAYHRRQSSSFPPPHAHVASDVHDRRPFSPTPHVHQPYRQPSVHASVPGPSAYHTAPIPNPPVYEQRHSYYQDAPPPPAAHHYTYDHAPDAYYARHSYSTAPHPAYDNGYSDNIRFHSHIGSMDHSAFNRKRRGNLPKEATNLMKQWFAENRDSPYPTEDQKAEMCHMTGLNMSQVR